MVSSAAGRLYCGRGGSAALRSGCAAGCLRAVAVHTRRTTHQDPRVSGVRGCCRSWGDGRSDLLKTVGTDWGVHGGRGLGHKTEVSRGQNRHWDDQNCLWGTPKVNGFSPESGCRRGCHSTRSLGFWTDRQRTFLTWGSGVGPYGAAGRRGRKRSCRSYGQGSSVSTVPRVDRGDSASVRPDVAVAGTSGVGRRVWTATCLSWVGRYRRTDACP